jgi:voltage-gated potassium channel
MFYLSLAFLALVAAELVFLIDVPRFVESLHEDDAEFYLHEADYLAKPEEKQYQISAVYWAKLCGVALLAIWPLFWLEYALHYWMRDRNRSLRKQLPAGFAICVFPFLRLCARAREQSDQIWFPVWGWQTVNRELHHRLERFFSLPMIWIALLILPVLACQIFLKETIVQYPFLRHALHFSAGLIWFAFAVEFLVMVSVSNKKAKYCAKHWLDLLIILLPLISFLRTLQFVRATKLINLARLQQVARMSRVYRMRGIAQRGFRAVLLLGVVHRLLGTKPEKRLVHLREMLLEKERELDQIRAEIAVLEGKCESKPNRDCDGRELASREM